MAEGQRDEPVLVLSLLPAGRGDRRLVIATVLVSLSTFCVAVPFARMILPKLPAFIPAYESALVVTDLVTAALLYGQFAIARSYALLVLASGYLFAALIAIVHALSFPGAFVEPGLLGAGPQSTAWLYMFWHIGFPVALAVYALLGNRRLLRGRQAAPAAILASIVVVAALVAAMTALATAGAAWLPAIMQGHRYTPAMIFVVASVWAASLSALAILFVRRPHAVLDVWLMAVLCAWLCDIALSAVLNGGRYDLGFYVGRAYGLAAASFVLIMLLQQMTAIYARLARSVEMERREREQRLAELRSELIHLSRLSELGQMVSALAHEVNQPLTAIGNYLRAGQRLTASGDAAVLQTALGKAADEATRASAIVGRLRGFIRKTESVRRPEDLAPVLEETVALALVGAERRNVEVTLSVDPRAGVALVDKVQVQQVLLNLIRNAIDATTGGAALRLAIATAPAEEQRIEVSVADNGPGLSASVRGRLFQPFVTTKQDGMGVGLSICQSIIEAHGGRIWAEENPGGGAVFRFTVPDAVASGRPGMA